jgi:hypothetical protein
MASEKNLITNARLSEVKTAESGLVDNLYAHANASLSKAHGLILWSLPHPTLDGGGNDISVYQDSHGDRVGNEFLRLTYNNTNYFVPLELSTLPGKNPLTGISPDINAVGITPIIPGGTAWVTDFTPQDEQDLIVTNNQLLLPHTLLGHWETHTGGIYQIIPQITTDSAGHRVGNYVARVVVDGVELWLPCDTRVGGPAQPMRMAFPAITTLQGTNCNYAAMGRDDNQFGYFWWNASTGGTLPYAFTWQYNTYQPLKTSGKFYLDPLLGSGTWLDVNMTVGVYQSMPSNPVSALSLITLPNKLTIRVDVGDSKRICATVRGKFTNTTGSTYTNYCLFQANDEDGSWIFTDPDVNQSASHVNIQNDPVWVNGYYYPPGPP